MDASRIKQLLEKRHLNTATEAELQELEDWYGSFEDKPGYFQYLNEQQKGTYFGLLYGNLQSGVFIKKPFLKSLWPVITIAASVLIMFAVGLYFYKDKAEEAGKGLAVNIKPGKNAATLTLSDGKKIYLNDSDNGELAKEAGIIITKTKDGQLVYTISPSEQGNQAKDKVNTLSTNRGETYEVVLPDKSKVWLNAASSITYNTNISAAAVRKVELSGEGYFEVARNPASPFLVVSAAQQVEVLGTHFNVNAYQEEGTIKTTLMEGSVKIASVDGDSKIISPGQQSVFLAGKLKVQSVDVDDVVAWKEGYIVFERERVEEVMRQISRWYDVEVSYKDESVKSKLLGGSMSRNVALAQVIKRLEQVGGLKIELKGRQLMIDKK